MNLSYHLESFPVPSTALLPPTSLCCIIFKSVKKWMRINIYLYCCLDLNFCLRSLAFSLTNSVSIFAQVRSAKYCFCLCGNVFILPLFLKDRFARYRIPGWQCFFPWALDFEKGIEYVIPLLSSSALFLLTRIQL